MDEKYLRHGDYTSTRDVVERIAKVDPTARIFGELDKDKNIVYHTAGDIFDEVMNLGEGLIAEGLQGGHIAIVSENSVRYVISDMTIASGVGVVVPIDAEAPAEHLAMLFAKADVNAVLCNARNLSKVEEARRSCPLVRNVITMDKKVEGYLSYDELLQEGRALSVFRNMTLDVEAPAKMLFTSGTTGANKCVVMTNANLAANIKNCLSGIKSTEGNTSMSVLPMHHGIEINSHIMTRVATGRLTYINDSIRTMMNNIRIFKPDCITVVPMISNAFYKAIWSGAEKAGKADKLRKGIRISNLLRKFGVDKTHTMFADVFEPFGGNLNMIVCGGAMLNPVVVRGLNDIGIHIENGYGITECGPVVSMNADTLTDHLSVGRPCSGLEAKIFNPDSDGVGELCIRGKSVSKGYYKDEEATEAVFDRDGFFHTGDAARIDKDGRIFMSGRMKNTIILENGKNVNPEEVENAIESAMDYVKEVVVYHSAASAEPDAPHLICAALFIEDEGKRADRDAIRSDLRAANAKLPSYKAVEYVEILSEPLERTPAKKIIRKNLPAVCSGSGIEI